MVYLTLLASNRTGTTEPVKCGLHELHPFQASSKEHKLLFPIFLFHFYYEFMAIHYLCLRCHAQRRQCCRPCSPTALGDPSPQKQRCEQVPDTHSRAATATSNYQDFKNALAYPFCTQWKYSWLLKRLVYCCALLQVSYWYNCNPL